MVSKTPTRSSTPPISAQLDAYAKVKNTAVMKASAFLKPIVQYAARDYFGGETVEDAICVAHRLARENLLNTLGFWDTPAYSKREVMDIYLDSVAQLAASELDGYLSIKPPALNFDLALADELADSANSHNIRLHCDSHGIEVAEESFAMIDRMLDRLPASKLGTSLPGRWARSLSDADWTLERGVVARVVKGQWPDPGDPKRDMRAGFLDVIERLAGQAHHVAVASHDPPLVAEATSRLRRAGTSFELELVYGKPVAKLLAWAHENTVPVRLYVPYGKGFIPNAIGMLRRNPRLAWDVVKVFVNPSERRSGPSR